MDTYVRISSTQIILPGWIHQQRGNAKKVNNQFYSLDDMYLNRDDPSRTSDAWLAKRWIKKVSEDLDIQGVDYVLPAFL